ncbi:hypothetical protein [Cognatiyoonia sp. IB215182]|nr:hypothetical protein [Cognatiyoonia sp. IB215182]MDX8355326.1 hypothetical protein [Cognatiyoonia sp. IB215182]
MSELLSVADSWEGNKAPETLRIAAQSSVGKSFLAQQFLRFC